MKSNTLKLLGCAALSFIFAIASHAQSVSSTPVGYVTQTIEAGTGTGRVFTPLSLPLYEPASITNATGSISTVNADGITVSGASFGDLSSSSSPYAVKITSGNAIGTNFLISSNTTDTLVFNFTLSGQSNTSSIAVGDNYEIITVDTLGSLFGGPTDGVIFGAAAQADADVVFVLTNGAWLAYYHNNSNWVRKSGRNTIVSNDLPLTLDTPLLLSRISSTSTSYVLTGTVPSTDSVLKINGSGLTFLANNTPADITLGNLALQNVNGFNVGSLSSSDSIYLYTNGAWLKYNYNGTNWIRQSGRNTINSNDVVVPSGSAFIFSKGTAGSDANANLGLQYTL